MSMDFGTIVVLILAFPVILAAVGLFIAFLQWLLGLVNTIIDLIEIMRG